MKNNIPQVLVICGPTASGKTSLALNIAKKLVGAIHESPARTSSLRGSTRQPAPIHRGLTPSTSVHILSADSRQIYRGLDIVTGKDIPTDLPSNIKFFGLDLANPSEVFNLSDYVQYAQIVIQKSILQNIPLIIVGGTGLYLKAITSDLLNTHVPPNPSLRLDLEQLDLASLQSSLSHLNPLKFSSLNNSDLNNPRRLIRAIEIASSPVGALRAMPAHKTLSFLPQFHFIGLRPDKKTLAEKIRHRVIERLENGAIQEVQTLLEKYSAQNLPTYTSLGVKQIIEYLDKKISSEELIDRWTTSEIEYARRQMVWFQKQPDIIWYDKSKVNNKLAEQLTGVFKQND